MYSLRPRHDIVVSTPEFPRNLLFRVYGDTWGELYLSMLAYRERTKYGETSNLITGPSLGLRSQTVQEERDRGG